MSDIAKIGVSICLILLAAALPTAHGHEAASGSETGAPSVLHSDHVRVVFKEPLRSVAREAVDLYQSAKTELETTFQWPVEFRPTLVLVNDRQRFQEMIGTDLIVAYALPRRNVMVIDYSRMTASPFRLNTTIKHELCHLLLHHYIEKSNLPKWFDEGVCQWASDGMAEIIMDHKQSHLTRAILSGRYFRMHALSTRFPGEKGSLQLAYAQSKSMMDYISREYGKESILTILDSLRNGLSFEKAIRNCLNISFRELESQWLDHLKQKKNWFTYLSIHMYEFLFVLGAIIVVVGFVRLMLKKRAYRDEDDLEDED
jgi:hypothetical protein